MVSDDEFLERIVAGIQAVSTQEAEVNWNEILNGRQFDVVVRFSLAGLSYLVLFEVKNKSRKAQSSDIEAFVTKARDNNANKAVFVTRAGFQTGAIDVARRHGIDLFTVGFEEGAPVLAPNGTYVAIDRRSDTQPTELELSIGEPRLVANITSITFGYLDGCEHSLPSEMSQMNYYVNKTKIGNKSLSEVIAATPIGLVEIGASSVKKRHFWPAKSINPPDDYFFPSGFATKLELHVTGALSRPMHGNTLLEPSAFTQPVVYTNVQTRSVMRFRLDELPLGGDALDVGTYYFIQHPLIYYYCERIDGEVITLHIVESFQCGEIITGTLKIHSGHARRYIPVRDRAIVSRLEKRLANFRAGRPGSGGRPG